MVLRCVPVGEPAMRVILAIAVGTVLLFATQRGADAQNYYETAKCQCEGRSGPNMKKKKIGPIYHFTVCSPAHAGCLGPQLDCISDHPRDCPEGRTVSVD